MVNVFPPEPEHFHQNELKTFPTSHLLVSVDSGPLDQNLTSCSVAARPLCRHGAGPRGGVWVHQRQLPDLLQQGVQVGGSALPELPLLLGEFGSARRLLLRLPGQPHHFLHQLAAAR